MFLTFKFYTWIKSGSYPTGMALQVFAFGYYLYLYQRDLYFCMLFHCFRCSLVSKWRTPFSNSYSAGIMQSITFYLRRSLFLLHLWRTAFTDIVLLIGSFLLSALWIHNLTPCFVLFLLRNLCIILWEFPSMWQVFLLLFSRFSLSLWLLTVWSQCLSVWASLSLHWLWSFKVLEYVCLFPFWDLGCFWPIFLQIFSWSLSLSLFLLGFP